MKIILETCLERTWWRLFQKRVESVPDEDYSNLLALSVPNEDYSRKCRERTWWRLFQERVVSVPDEDYSNLLALSLPDEDYSRNVSWAYLMKIIPIF